MKTKIEQQEERKQFREDWEQKNGKNSIVITKPSIKQLIEILQQLDGQDEFTLKTDAQEEVKTFGYPVTEISFYPDVPTHLYLERSDGRVFDIYRKLPDNVMTEFEKLLEDKKHFGIPIEEVVKEARKKTEEK